VNYLCHFFIDANPQESPEYHTGLILPDLARGQVFGLNKANFLENQILKGCQKHFQADKKFHHSTFFENGSKQCIDFIKKMPFTNKVERKWFIGHVLFEMLLDRLLVQHHLEVAPAFYQQIRSVDEQLLQQFLIDFKCPDPARFMRGFEHFRTAAYIGNYPDNNLFAYSLSRVLKRVGLPELSFSDKVVLMEGISEMENTMFVNRQKLFLELKNIFE
jgi:hypothetical protein